MRARFGIAAVVALSIHQGVAAARSDGLSPNWSGYVATGSPFTAVAGTWTVPAADCLAKSSATTAASFWVGLGGSEPDSKEIEQIGTDSDCNSDGTESYFAWYELWPSRAVNLRLPIEAGDRVRASVRVQGAAVVLEIANVETGHRFRRTLMLPRPDTSSAEWIAEAPSMKVHRGTPYLSLTRFGTVRFTHATATARGRTAPIGDSAWTAERVTLDSFPKLAGSTADRFLGALNRARVDPGRLSRDGSAFSLTWTANRQSNDASADAA